MGPDLSQVSILLLSSCTSIPRSRAWDAGTILMQQVILMSMDRRCPKTRKCLLETRSTQLIGVQACQCVAKLMSESTAGITKGSPVYSSKNVTELKSLQQLQSTPANDWHYCFARSQSSGSMVLTMTAFKGHSKTFLVMSSADSASRWFRSEMVNGCLQPDG